MNTTNFFSGTNAVLDFLNPDINKIPLPLVEIPKHLNPFYNDGLRIYAKLLNMLPLANVKSLPAFSMLQHASTDGILDSVTHIAESSSGNTTSSLAIIARLMGIEHTQAFVSHEVSHGKFQLLRLLGVEPIVNEEPICPDPTDSTSVIHKAKQAAERPGWFNPGQYENDFNPLIHERFTAPQIYAQLDGDLQLFSAGLGTTGTMVGCSRFFKMRNTSIQTIGVVRSPNNPIPGVRSQGLLNMVNFDWETYVDTIEEIGTIESFEKSLSLIRHGLLVGPSSGFAFAGLLKHIASLHENGDLDILKNEQGIINAVFICPDSPFPYINDYFTYLEDSLFPPVHNEHLLLHKLQFQNAHQSEGKDCTISPLDAYDLIYTEKVDMLWDSLKREDDISLRKDVIVLDVRNEAEFAEFHLPGSTHFEYFRFMKNIDKEIPTLTDKTVILVCKLGMKSHSLSHLLRERGIDAYNLQGGLTSWSALDLPRYKPKACVR